MGIAGDVTEEESPALLRVKLEGMGWAAEAKDSVIVYLRKKLQDLMVKRRADEEALVAAAARNEQLERDLRLSRERESALEATVSEMHRRLGRLEDAEERLASQLGQLEAESIEQSALFHSHLNLLRSQLRDKDLALSTLQSAHSKFSFTRSASS